MSHQVGFIFCTFHGSVSNNTHLAPGLWDVTDEIGRDP